MLNQKQLALDVITLWPHEFRPDLARLFALMNPKRAGLFAFRAHKAAA